MKILHLSTSDVEGGAARAAYRIHQGLKAKSVHSQMLVRAKSSIDRTVIPQEDLLTKLGPRSNNLPLKLYPQRERKMFSPQWFPDMIAPQVKQLNPDLILLHWICNGYVKIETLAKFHKPLVWTLHDMWPLTGGCHSSGDCDRYKLSCGSCPQLNNQTNWDLSHWVWQRKVKAWQDLNLTIVSPSHWLADCAKSSSIFQNFSIEVIPHGLDLTKYKPIEQKLARTLLNLPQDKQLISFGSGSTKDPNKGFHFLQEALEKLRQSEWKERIELVVFGSSPPDNPKSLGFKTHYLERFHDDLSLAIVFSAADVLVVPSKQEAFGQTASESLACGTPVVAFATTGLKDIIDSHHNGYLAKPFESEDLARGIAWVLGNDERHQKLRSNARVKAVREFSLELQAHRYLSLISNILNV